MVSGEVFERAGLARARRTSFPSWSAGRKRMTVDHFLSHGLAGGVGIKAVVGWESWAQERIEPAGIGAGTGGGKAEGLGVQHRIH